MRPARPEHRARRRRCDRSAFNAPVILKPSRLASAGRALVILLAALGCTTAPLSLPLKLALLMLCGLCLWQLEQQARQVAGSELMLEDRASPQLLLRRADGAVMRGRYAGYALLGSVAVFLFVEREGWRRLLGAKRIAVLRDATDADAFRRLRARVRLMRAG